jgi:hypothetical protein
MIRCTRESHSTEACKATLRSKFPHMNGMGRRRASLYLLVCAPVLESCASLIPILLPRFLFSWRLPRSRHIDD